MIQSHTEKQPESTQSTALDVSGSHIKETLSSLSTLLAADALVKEATQIQNNIRRLCNVLSHKRTYLES